MKVTSVIIGLLIIFVLLLSACSQKYVCSDGSTVDAPSLCPKQKQEAPKFCTVDNDCPGGYCDADAQNPEKNRCRYTCFDENNCPIGSHCSQLPVGKRCIWEDE